MFENKQQGLIPFRKFVRRMARCVIFAAAILTVALMIGVVGYHVFAQLSWLDSFLNASMILTGMGPVNALSGAAAKLFASFYALFSGLVFVSVITIALTPVFHRIVHKFHLSEEAQRGETRPPRRDPK